MDSRRRYRALFVALIVCSLFVLGVQATTGGGAEVSASATSGGTGPIDERGDRVAPPRDHVTVIATDSNSWLGQESEGARANAELLSIHPNGTVGYYDDTHTRYWDVDPVPGRETTVEYVYADHLNASECGGEEVCTRNGIERANLTTGEVTPVYSRVTPGKHSTRWHDADRLSPTRVAIADIGRDRVVVVNTTTELVEWSWDARAAYDVEGSGGPYPSDWTHLNDVEVLDDGRLMASVRNHDQVVFLDRETGLQRNRTLGSDGDHETLYEQHNPDYINGSNGGPAVLVADSENNRVVEYGRTDGEWRRDWTWRDDRLQWPRDADRLPDGHTLVTDSNGNRVVEVDDDGNVVWSVAVAFPYEAERLETGDESTGGPGADEANLTGTGGSVGERATGGDAAGGSDGSTPTYAGVVGRATGKWFNAVAYVLPVWMDQWGVLALLVLVGTIPVWAAAELRWADRSIAFRSPLTVEREE